MSTIVAIPPPPPLPRYINPNSLQLFIQAAQDGDMENVEQYLEISTKRYVSTINSQNSEGYTALHVAYARGHVNVCAYLVENGASISVKTRDSACWSVFEAGKIQGGPLLTAIYPKLKGKVLTSSECSICESKMALYPLDCTHQFCLDCLTHWFSTLVDQSLEITCPHRHCNKPVDSISHLSLFLTHQQLDTYLTQRLRWRIATMSDFWWCPECPSGGFLCDSECGVVSCGDCGRPWCKECGQIPHIGMSCEEATAKWTEEEHLCKEWKSQKTKSCPKCNTAIEKNGGCSHVKCFLCKYEFCWICLGVYVGRLTHGDVCPCKT